MALQNNERMKQAQEKNVKNKIQTLKAKLLVQKMQSNLKNMNNESPQNPRKTGNKGKTGIEMNNPKHPKNMKNELETDASESINTHKNSEGFWRKCLDCLGLAEMPENERFIKQ